MRVPLTNTSYAILGLLSLRPHSAYDLTQQARRSLRFVWPTSESQLYAEPKRLVREGLLQRTVEEYGKRSRQVYAITAKGQAALRAWLESSPSQTSPGSEILLRVMLADRADKETLLNAIGDWRRALEEERRAGIALMEEQLAGTAPYAERANLNVLWWVLAAEQRRITAAWLDFAEGEVMRWPDTNPRPLDARARRHVRALVRRQPVLE